MEYTIIEKISIVIMFFAITVAILLIIFSFLEKRNF